MSKPPSQPQGPKPPPQLIHESLESLKKIVELDTDSSLADLSLLEKLNNEATVRYRSIQEDMNQFQETLRSEEKAIDTIENMGPKLDQLESQVDKLLTLSKEMDEWSRELEVKVKRYTR